MSEFYYIAIIIVILIIGFFHFQSMSYPRVLYFYKPGCPACKEFSKTWSTLTREVNMNYRVINCENPESDKLKMMYSITSVPTIVKIKNDEWEQYKGEMTFEKVRDYISK